MIVKDGDGYKMQLTLGDLLDSISFLKSIMDSIKTYADSEEAIKLLKVAIESMMAFIQEYFADEFLELSEDDERSDT